MLLELVKNVDGYMSDPQKVSNFQGSDTSAATFSESTSNIAPKWQQTNWNSKTATSYPPFSNVNQNSSNTIFHKKPQQSKTNPTKCKITKIYSHKRETRTNTKHPNLFFFFFENPPETFQKIDSFSVPSSFLKLIKRTNPFSLKLNTYNRSQASKKSKKNSYPLTKSNRLIEKTRWEREKSYR